LASAVETANLWKVPATTPVQVRLSSLARLPWGSFQHLASVFALIALNWTVIVSHADTPAVASGQPPRVLVLYSNERLLPANVVADEAIRATFMAGTHGKVEFYSEFLDVDRFPGEAEQDRERDFLADKYRQRPPDLVIAGGRSALAFLLKYRATLFSKLPIVHCAVSLDELPNPMPDDRIVGVPLVPGAASTVELALRVQPDTTRVVIVDGSTEVDRQLALGPGGEFSRFKDRVTMTWLTKRSLTELRRELSGLPDHTVVLYRTLFRDSAGKVFTPRDALDNIAPASRVPIYGYYDTYLGHGIVGGSMVTFEAIGRCAAQIGLRILGGEDPQVAARSESHEAVPMFDWRQLRRWKIDEKLLPASSVVRFRPPTAWEKYKDYAVVGLFIILAQTATIVGLLVQRTRRRGAEEFARDLGGRLVNAQEDIRRRIARDLHDDLSQRLALMSVELEMLEQKLPAQPETITGPMQKISGDVRNLSSEVHRLAHELHPAKLDQLGLAAAVRGFCKELSEANQIAIEFEAGDLPRVMPNDLTLCVYRVLQEALQNAIKHSDATRVKVELATNGEKLHLIVTDDGHGFDPRAIKIKPSLGIVSMRERVRMVKGLISVQSRPGEGTRIEVRVPTSARAAEA
jgi:signal transduction histidine kinase